MEDPVHTIFVIRGSENVGDDELAASGDNDRIIAEVSVLEQNSSILFVNADGVLNGCAFTCTIDERGAVKMLV